MADVPSFDSLVEQHEARMAREAEIAAYQANPANGLTHSGEAYEVRMRFLAENAERLSRLRGEVVFALEALDFAGLDPTAEIRDVGPTTLKTFSRPLGAHAAALPVVPGWKMLTFDWMDLDHNKAHPRRVHTKTDGLALGINGRIYYTRPDGAYLTGSPIELRSPKITQLVGGRRRTFEAEHVRQGLANLVAHARAAYQMAHPPEPDAGFADLEFAE